MALVYLAVGSNLGHCRENLDKAQSALRKLPSVTFLKMSPLYDTEPVGGPPQGNYLNAVWKIETIMEPEALLNVLLKIEAEQGRVRRIANDARPLDLDILSYDRQVIKSPKLTLPHPRLHERWFVLKPLCDIAPEWWHPVLEKTASELLETLTQKLKD